MNGLKKLRCPKSTLKRCSYSWIVIQPSPRRRFNALVTDFIYNHLVLTFSPSRHDANINLLDRLSENQEIDHDTASPREALKQKHSHVNVANLWSQLWKVRENTRKAEMSNSRPHRGFRGLRLFGSFDRPKSSSPPACLCNT